MSVAMWMSIVRSTLSRSSVRLFLFPSYTTASLCDVQCQSLAVSGCRYLSKSSRSELRDPVVEKAFLDRFRELQRHPVASEVVKLFWFLATESRDLDNDGVFVDVCNFAGTLARDFTPKEISLLIRISLQNVQRPPKALLQNIAESLTASRDLSAFPPVLLINILMHISKRQKQDMGFRTTHDHPIVFPGQTELVNVILEALMTERPFDGWTAAEVVSVFYSAAVLGAASTKAMDGLKDLLLIHLKQLTPRDVANVVYAAANVQFKDQTLLTAVTRQYTQSHNRSAEMSNLGLLLYGLTMVNDILQPPSDVVRLCNHATPHHLIRTSNAGLACLFYSLGKLSIKNAHLNGLISFEVQKATRLASFEGQQLLSILVAIRDLDYKDDAMITALSREILVGKDPASGEDRISQLKTVELCGILQAWSRMHLRRDWAMQVILAELLKDHRRPDIDAVSAALILHSMGIAGIYDEAAFDYIHSEWFTWEKLTQFDDHLLAAMICGLARMPVINNLSVMRPLMWEMTKNDRLQRCDDITLVGVIHAIVSIPELKPKDIRILKLLFKEAMMDRRLLEMSGRCLGLLMHGLGKCSFLSKRLIYAETIVHKVLDRRLTQMDNQALANMLWSLSRMFYPHRDHVEQLARELLQQRRSNGHREKGCIQLSHAVLALGDLGIQGCQDLLDFVALSLIQNGVRDIPSVGLVLLITRLSKLAYRHDVLYRLLVGEALRKERMKKMHPGDLPMIVEAISRLGYATLLEESLLMGLKGIDDFGRYTAADLWRLLRTVVGLRGNHSIVERLRREWEERRLRENRRLFPATGGVD